MYLVLNFNHPLTRRQRVGIEDAIGMSVTEMHVPCSIDMDMPIVPQMSQIISGINIGDEVWREEEILILLPGMGVAAGVLVAALTAKMGSYPIIIRLKKVGQGKSGWYEFAEFIDSQAVYQSHLYDTEFRWKDDDV